MQYLELEYTKIRVVDFDLEEPLVLPREIDFSQWLASNITIFFQFDQSAVQHYLRVLHWGHLSRTLRQPATQYTRGMTRRFRRQSALLHNMSTL